MRLWHARKMVKVPFLWHKVGIIVRLDTLSNHAKENYIKIHTRSIINRELCECVWAFHYILRVKGEHAHFD